MTEQLIRQMAAEAVAAAHPRAEKYYHLCWWDGRLQCLHVHHTDEVHRVFYAASGEVFGSGLSSHQWQLVTTRVMEFCRGRGIVPRRGAGRRKARTPGASSTERLQVTAFDSMRLRVLLTSVRTPGSGRNTYLDRLGKLLETADTVAPQEVGDDVITMNSRGRLKDVPEGDGVTFSLLFPADAQAEPDFDKMKISILTPIGLSLLGRRVGDTVEGRVKIQELMYQPEAAGDFDI